MNGRRYFRALEKKMALTLILVSLTPLILITGLMGYYFETSYRQTLLENLKGMLKGHQQRIDSYLNGTLSDVEFLAESSRYEDLARGDYLQDKLLVLQNAYPGVFVDLGVVNEAGMQISYAGDLKLLGADYSQAAWFQEAMKRDYFLSDVFLGLRRRQHFIICIRKKRLRSDWLLRATVNFVDFNSLLDAIHVGKTGSAFIVNSKAELQSHPRTEMIANMAELLRITPWTKGEERPLTGAADPGVHEVKVISSQSNVLTGTVQSGKGTTLFILMPLRRGEWTLVYQQERDDAFVEINHARATALTIFFFGGLAVLVAGVFISHKAVRRIEKAELEKERMNEQVTEAQKLASIGELAAGVAHEINNPVAIMIEHAGWMEDLLAEEELRESQNLSEFKRSLKQIGLQGNRCKEITHKLLGFARRTDPVRKSIHLNEILEEIMSVCKKSPKFEGIRVYTKLDPGLPQVLASSTEMHEVFVNLINNAVDAMGPGGGTLVLRSRTEGSEAVVDISDTGHGMTKTVMGRIFDPFFTTKSAGQGTGLGLSICYGIVKKLGGSLTVDSTVGVGTTFHVHIPFRAAGT